MGKGKDAMNISELMYKESIFQEIIETNKKLLALFLLSLYIYDCVFAVLNLFS